MSHQITLADLREEYQKLFDNATIKPDWEEKVKSIADKICSEKSRYHKIQEAIGVPWYVVAIIHNMEASGNFSCHLYNGDPLTDRTYHVPKGRPVSGSPPFTWEESAIDALNYDGLNKWEDWSIPGILFNLEKYNGWGYRIHHPGVKSPYLWSGTSVYSQGKYVADGKFDSTAVSSQVGGAAILKILEKQGELQEATEFATWLEIFPNTEAKLAPFTLVAWKGGNKEPVEVTQTRKTTELVEFLERNNQAKTFTVAKPDKKKPALKEIQVKEPQTSKSEVNLDVPYLSQLKNKHCPTTSCLATSTAMCAKFLGVKAKPHERLADEFYLELVNKIGDRFAHDNIVKLLAIYGVSDVFKIDATWQEVKEHLIDGLPIIYSGHLTHSGHCIVIKGFEGDKYRVNDPYGEFFYSGYRTDLTGHNLLYSQKLLSTKSMTGDLNITWAHFVGKK